MGCTAARIEARRLMCALDWQRGKSEFWAQADAERDACKQRKQSSTQSSHAIRRAQKSDPLGLAAPACDATGGRDACCSALGPCVPTGATLELDSGSVRKLERDGRARSARRTVHIRRWVGFDQKRAWIMDVKTQEAARKASDRAKSVLDKDPRGLEVARSQRSAGKSRVSSACIKGPSIQAQVAGRLEP